MTQAKVDEDGHFDYLPRGAYDPARVRSLSLYLRWRDGSGEWPSFDRLVNLESLSYLPAARVSAETFAQLRQLPKLRAVHLWFTGEPVPPGVFALSQIEDLGLDNGDLTELPDRFAQLPALRALDLRSNRLRALPPSIGRLTRLRELNLDSNALAATPDLSGCIALEALDLTDNELRAIDVALLPGGLRELRLCGCPIAALPAELASFAALRVLDARGCPLEHVPDGLRAMQALGSLLLDASVAAH